MLRIKTVTVFTTFGLLFGCTAADPVPFQFDAGSRQDVLPATPDFEYVCPSVPAVAPIIQSAPQSTEYRKVPLRGVAPGADTVIADGPAGVASPAVVGSDGRFCLDVELLPEAMNTISVIAITAGCKSQAARVRIDQHAGGKTDAISPSVSNVALGSPVTASSDAEDGTVAMTTDGELSSVAQFDMFDPDVQMKTDKFIWIKVNLRKAYTVSKIKLHWGAVAKDEKSYALCYTLLLSSAEHPGDPTTADPDWRIVQETKHGSFNVQDVSFSPERARWAALLLYEDDAVRWNAYERFDLAEIEVFGQDPNGVPPPVPDSCY